MQTGLGHKLSGPDANKCDLNQTDEVALSERLGHDDYRGRRLYL